MSTPSTHAPTGASRALAWLSDNLTVVLTVSGVLLYGGSRAALEAFYQPLGTAASEVGVSYFEIVATAGIGIGMNALTYFIIGAAIIAWMYGLTLVSLWVLRRFRRNTFTYLDYLHERRLEYKPLRTMVGFGVLLVFLQVFTQWLTSLQSRPLSWVGPALTVFILIVTPVMFPIAFAVGATRRAPDDPSPPSDFINDMVDLLRGDGARLLIALLPFLLIGNTILASEQLGASYAEDVKAGREVSSTAQAAIPFQASCVLLAPTGAPTSPAAEQLQGSKLLYLGQSSGVSVLYQVGAGTVRVPSGSVVLQPASTPCRT